MKILISGATGLIGSDLVPYLTQRGHEITRLVRSNPQRNDILWNPSTGDLDSTRLAGFDAVIHLLGANLAARRWSEAYKREIVNSRLQSTRLLSTALSSLADKPYTFICASATGFYGDNGDHVVAEDLKQGTGFLAELVARWEAETTPAAEAGIRVVTLRTGVVLTKQGGALGKMRLPFALGLGGRLGNGRQYMSWIALDDLLAVFAHILTDASLRGPVNAVAPNPVTNAEYARALGKALHRPALIPVPPFILQALFGKEPAAMLLYSSERVIPTKLLTSGFVFRYPEIAQALKAALQG